MKTTNKLPVKILGHIKHFINKCSRDNIAAIAGQSAFFMILSFVPFVMFVISLVVLVFGDPSKINVENPANNELIKSFYVLFEYLYNTLSQSSNAVIISAVITLWSAGKGMYIITDGIQRIYRLPIKGLWIIRRIYAMGYTVVMLIIMMISFAFILLNSAWEIMISDDLKQVPAVTKTLYAYRYVLITIVLSVAMTFAMKLFLSLKIKDKRWRKFRVLFPGMLFTNIAWNALTAGMGIYMKYFGVSSLYGQLGAVMYMMIWIYFAMYLLLCGIQINFIYREYFYRFKLRNLFKRKKKKTPEEPESKEDNLPEETESKESKLPEESKINS